MKNQKIEGIYCELEPLNLEKHGRDLWQAIRGNDDLWRYLLNGPYADEESFFTWLESCKNHASRIYFSVIDKNSKKALGVLALINCDPNHKTVEVGGIIFSPTMQKTRISSEAIYLIAKYVFEDLNFQRLQWICNNKNEASKKSAKRFGFSFEGILRQHLIAKGAKRDSAFFSILDNEWKNIKAAFEIWLNPNNFDETGKQKTKLQIAQ